MKRMVMAREDARFIYCLRAGARRLKGHHLWAQFIGCEPPGSAFRHTTLSRRRRAVQERAR